MKRLSLTRSELEALVSAMAREVLGRDGEAVERAGGVAASPSDFRSLARLFDHALLAPQTTADDVEQACEEAAHLGFAALVVQPAWISLAARRLRGTNVRAATVAGFPFGAGLTSAKRAEAEAAIRSGAEEIGVVLNIGALRSGDLARAELDIRGVLEVCHAARISAGVIIESGFLSDEQKTAACRMAKEAGAEFVKASTGFGPSGPREADVRRIREAMGPEMGVTIAGIQTLAEALRMLQAGASRVETSATASIFAEAAGQTN